MSLTTNLPSGNPVTVQSKGKDRYGRTLAYVLLPDGRNLNHEIVGNGFGWWYERYAKNETKLNELQASARMKRLGLWRDKEPEPPWEFRKQRRNGRK